MFDRSKRTRRTLSSLPSRTDALTALRADFQDSKRALRSAVRPPYSPAAIGTLTLATLAITGVAAYAAWRGWQAARPRGNYAVPQPAKAVDLSRYVGLWYEWARYENRFEQGCERVTAEYRPSRNGTLRVINTCGCRPDDPAAHRAVGRAKIIEGTGNTKLKVSFFGPFYVGDYWVLDHDDDYRWSIVGEPSGRYLWLLTRDAEPDEHTVAIMMARVVAMGYDTTLLRLTQQ